MDLMRNVNYDEYFLSRVEVVGKRTVLDSMALMVAFEVIILSLLSNPRCRRKLG
jgi:hypothetical protein